ncbi:diguanylate cyclase [Paeniclostridium sordellii]|nr:diguanylate cyclase [Paeniclostridium sordellii]MSB59045.1 diguanylate cyclase [Paeniclostridium sordellii]
MKLAKSNKYICIFIVFIGAYFLFLNINSINEIRESKKGILNESKLQIQEGKYDLAEKNLEKIANDKHIFNALSKSDKFNVYNYLGIINTFQGETVNAILMYEKADKYVSRGNKYKIDINSAIAYRHMGEYLKSAEILVGIIRTKDGNEAEDARIKTYALLNLAEIYLHIGDMSEFQSILNKTEGYLDKLPQYHKDDLLIMYYSDLIVSEVYNNKLEKVKYYFDKIESLEAKNSEIYYTENKMLKIRAYAIYYKKIGETDKALEEFKKLELYGAKEGDNYISKFAISERINIYKKQGNQEEYEKLIEEYYNEDKEISTINNRQYKFHLSNRILEQNKVTIMKRTVILFILINVALVIVVILIYKNMKKSRIESMKDALCGVYNRRYFELYKKNIRKKDFPISFLMIDVDYFKLYNDNYGHQSGDEVLKLISNVLKYSCRGNDMIFRYGGEEFCVVLKNTFKDEAIGFAKRIKYNISKEEVKHDYSEVENYITLSIGISTIYSKENLKEAINLADRALYTSKANGRNRYTHIEDL